MGVKAVEHDTALLILLGRLQDHLTKRRLRSLRRGLSESFIERPIQRMLFERFRIPHATWQDQDVTPINMQSKRGCIAAAFDDVNGTCGKREYGAGCQRHLSGLAQLAVFTLVKRVSFFTRQLQNCSPSAVSVRWRAAPDGKAHLEERELRRSIKHLPRIAACARDKREQLFDVFHSTAQ